MLKILILKNIFFKKRKMKFTFKYFLKPCGLDLMDLSY